MKALLAKGHQVYAICPKGAKNDALRELGCQVVSYEIDRSSLNPFQERRTIQNLYETIKDLNIDILHTFTAKPNIYGTLAGKKAGIPIILNLVEGLGSFYVRHSLKNYAVRYLIERLYQKVFTLSNGVVFVNTSDPAYMVSKYIISAEHVKIIKSVGIDTQVFSMQHYPSTRILELKKRFCMEHQMVVLMVARAIFDKGIKEYYEAVASLKKKFLHVNFILIGGLDEGNPSCASEAFLNQGDVLWLGHRDDVKDWIAISDIFVLPSYKEGLPVTLLEAAAMAKPIVTTNTSGCQEVVDDGYNGFLVPTHDALALADKIEYLLMNASLRNIMGERGQKKVLDAFDVNKVVAQYMEYYETFF